MEEESIYRKVWKVEDECKLVSLHGKALPATSSQKTFSCEVWHFL